MRKPDYAPSSLAVARRHYELEIALQKYRQEFLDRLPHVAWCQCRKCLRLPEGE